MSPFELHSMPSFKLFLCTASSSHLLLSVSFETSLATMIDLGSFLFLAGE